ncbi:MAG: FKBP-type peptidyl-prolyl cis-trans isomerase [Prevotellaceae bacterium]|jgi:FKBP-type peptidyl-prolyl cis-trans isomerase FklB|nr:FKBP-type peptidyl-prolyl cis-trans isomerase [Prevotellaceae bacterium]
MKKSTLIMAIAASLSLGLASCTAQVPKANLKTDIDSVSYAIGINRTNGLEQYLEQKGWKKSDFINGLAEGVTEKVSDNKAFNFGKRIGLEIVSDMFDQFNQQIFADDSTQSISLDNLVAGFFAGTMNDTTIMKMAETQAYLQTAVQRIQEKAIENRYADNKTAGEQFLAENKTKEGVITTASGLQYKVITKGNGQIPKTTDRVKVHYKGTLIDGKEFDSSYSRNEPTTFRADQVIKGWTEALTLMPVGSKWELYIPQDLAYGAREMDKITPFSTLVFEVELLDIEKEQPKK